MNIMPCRIFPNGIFLLSLGKYQSSALGMLFMWYHSLLGLCSFCILVLVASSSIFFMWSCC